MRIKKDIIISDEIAAIVSKIRDIGYVFSITKITGTSKYTVLTDNLYSIQNNDYVQLTTNKRNELVQISNVNRNSKTFEVTLTSQTGTETGTWTNTRPFFEVGVESEIANIVQQKDKTIAMKNQNYPLIWLVQNYQMKKSAMSDVFDFDTKLIILLIVHATANEMTLQSYEHSFKPILNPLRDSLIQKLKLSTKVIDRNFSYTETPLTQRNSNIEKNSILAYTDAILLELNLKFYKQYSNIN